MSETQGLDQLEDLFHRAADLAPPERDRLLEEVRARDPSLCAQLERLLEREDRQGAVSATGPLVDAFAEERQSVDGTPPSGFGPYRLLRRLGAGGMGVVYEALQTEPIERTVAVKVLSSCGDSQRVVARFEGERRTLALMSHPNIATVHDAGTSDLGMPYFVMERVEGQPITDYCDGERLAVGERLRLFSQVCDAVQHAHQKGIIHRDLKPSNILVSGDRDQAMAKVIDFGIAKALGEESSELTRHGEAVGTPDYMSPEQARGEVEAVDTRSDVYSLGVILYELLSGKRPFDERPRSSATGTADPSDAERPSDRITRVSEETTEIAKLRRTTPPHLRRALRGDLDWITLRSLAADREQRYPTAESLRADLARHLDGQPVEAGPPTFRYRAAKFARRHRLLLLASCVVLVTLVAGVIGTGVGLLRARRAEATARAEAASARRVTDLLMDVFQETSPDRTDGRELSARELLDGAAAKVRAGLQQETFERGRLLRTLGVVYSNLGDFQQSRDVLDEAIALIRESAPGDELELARCLRDLGVLELRLGRDDDAEAALRESIAIQERLLGADNPELGPTLNQLAILLKVNQPEESLRLYRRTHRMIVSDRGADDPDAAIVLANIGVIEVNRRNYEAAREVFEQSLRVLEEKLGEDDPRTAAGLANLAMTHLNLGDYERALEIQRRAMRSAQKSQGEDHPAVGADHVTLSRILEALGDLPAALEAAERAGEILEPRLGRTYHLTRVATRQRAKLLFYLGDTDGARRALEDRLEESDSTGAKLAFLSCRLVLAEIERLEGDPLSAARILDSVLAEEALDKDLGLRRDALWHRAWTLAMLAEPEAAERALAEARALSEGTEQPRSSRLYSEAKLLAAAGETRAALDRLQMAVENGYRHHAPLHDPAFSRLRELPGFGALARSIEGV